MKEPPSAYPCPRQKRLVYRRRVGEWTIAVSNDFGMAKMEVNGHASPGFSLTKVEWLICCAILRCAVE